MPFLVMVYSNIVMLRTGILFSLFGFCYLGGVLNPKHSKHTLQPFVNQNVENILKDN